MSNYIEKVNTKEIIVLSTSLMFSDGVVDSQLHDPNNSENNHAHNKNETETEKPNESDNGNNDNQVKSIINDTKIDGTSIEQLENLIELNNHREDNNKNKDENNTRNEGYVCTQNDKDNKKNKENMDNDNECNDYILEKFIEPNQIHDLNEGIYIEYDDSALEKLLSLHSNENYVQKLQYILRLGELIYIIGEDGISKLPQILRSIINDTDEFKLALCGQIDSIIKFFLKRQSKGYNEIIQYIIPALCDLLSTKSFEIKKKVGEIMLTLANILNEEDKGKHILTLCLNMAHDDHNEDNRIIAIQLLSNMCTKFGKSICEQFISLEYLSLSEDPQKKVRQQIVKNLPIISKTVSTKFFNQRLLPLFYRLCEDTSQDIIVSCVEIIVDIASIADSDSRQSNLTTKFLHFLKDGIKPVRVTAYKKLGPFIALFRDLKIDEKLIEAYLQMPEKNISNLSKDNEIMIACAYNFPAVLFTLGSQAWPQLQKLFWTLINQDIQVKKPLVCALHEIAKIIGEETSENELFAFEIACLHDKNDEIKYGAIKNLGLFLKVFNIQRRERMADYFSELQKDEKKWRIRELIAAQLGTLATIFTTQTIVEFILPTSFALCSDPVSTVRETACSNIHRVLMSLYNTNHRDKIIEKIKEFSASNKYTNRQAFICMCSKLMDQIEIFEKKFLKILVSLGNDKINNVRLYLSKMLRKKFDERCPMAFNKEILLLIQNLQIDKSRDVRMPVEDLELPLPPSHIISSPYKKTNKPSNSSTPIMGRSLKFSFINTKTPDEKIEKETNQRIESQQYAQR